jgi:serine/threonine-protein kinase RsbW
MKRQWTLTSELDHIGPVVEAIVAMCHDAGFSPRHCRLNVPVAVTEALANAMMRGNAGVAERQVLVAVALVADELVVDVTDEGDGFDFELVARTPDDEGWLDREDGRGLFLMRQLMDLVENHRLDAGHRVRLVLRRT